jgi:CLIP-associating protein 1/2
MQIYNGRELAQQLQQIRDVIGDNTKDWSKRVDALKTLRGLLMAGAQDYDEWAADVRPMCTALQTVAADLRSQTLREACITIA